MDSQSDRARFVPREVVGRIECHIDDTTYVVPITYAYGGEFM